MVRNPLSSFLYFTLPDLKRFTLRRVMPQGYNKHILVSEKTFSLILWKRVGHDTGRLWLPVTIADRTRKTIARRPPSCLQSRHFRFYPPLPSQVFLVRWQFLFFINRKIKKRFSVWISPALILFPVVSLHMNCFVKFEFLISLNLGNRKLKIQF